MTTTMPTTSAIPHSTRTGWSTLAGSLLVGALATLAACSSTPPPAAPAAPAPAPAAAPAPAPKPAPVAAAPAPAPAAPPAATRPAPAPAAQAKPLPAYLDPNSDISQKRSVLFDFDQAAIKPDYTGLVQRHGSYLAGNPTLAVRIEGNTDERGSSEYNLALGQRRADAVKKALELAGAKGAQMEAISWGEGHPRAQGHDEAAWSQNRRADIVYPSK
jgi:peptidoglycan-associated lipoprotein